MTQSHDRAEANSRTNAIAASTPAPGAAEQEQILLGGEAGIHGRELPGQADQAPYRGGLAHDVAAEHVGPAAG